MTLFGTAGIRGDVTKTVTPELALAIGRAVAIDADGEAFVLGRDGRETGRALADAVAAGLQSGGSDVRRIGEVPTPALAWASRGRRGVMVTASHNPPRDNGIKCFVEGVEYDRDAEARIEDVRDRGAAPVEWDRWGGSERSDVLDSYREIVVAYAEGHGSALEGLSVAVDCGNGMAGLATPQVLRSLGAHVVTLNANVDGHFPGRESKPTPESLRDLREFVADGTFAFGVGHDGDADRIAIVGPEGNVVHEDTVLAILAEYYVRESDVDDPVVVTTPNASGRIDERVEAAGGRVERVRLGALHEGIVDAEEAGGDVVYAAEPWKHIHPGLGGWIDGVASAAVLARLVADVGGIEDLGEPVTERPYRKTNVECPDGRKAGAMERLVSALPDRFPEAEVDTDHGVRLDFPDGSWILVRPSGTEPYLRVYAESESVDELVGEAVACVEDAVEHS